jgi:hypothetical protein
MRFYDYDRIWDLHLLGQLLGYTLMGHEDRHFKEWTVGFVRCFGY